MQNWILFTRIMTSQLENELCCFTHCSGVYEQINIVNNVDVDDWTVEWVIIASNVSGVINCWLTISV